MTKPKTLEQLMMISRRKKPILKPKMILRASWIL